MAELAQPLLNSTRLDQSMVLTALAFIALWWLVIGFDLFNIAQEQVRRLAKRLLRPFRPENSDG